MESLEKLVQALPTRHREALAWFASRAGAVENWPSPLHTAEGDETLLATKAKGIYKPGWSQYALSVRQTLNGMYPDKEPSHRPDGTWTYKYFQENPDPTLRDSEYTNVGLMACIKDRVPVGVMRQVSGKPHVQYQILGVALVSNWDDGHFYLEGFSPSGVGHPPGPAAEIAQLATEEQEKAAATCEFDPTSTTDARKRTVAQIIRRQGQPEFRKKVIEAYGGRCALTSCDAIPALEAAHITPYRGPETNRVDNGILLRSDIHTIFDLGLIAVDETTLAVMIAPELAETAYASMAGQAMSVPEDPRLRPSREALKAHRLWTGLNP